jgi:polygalacturonase
MKTILPLVLLLAVAVNAAPPALRFNVRDYGAVGDGVQKDTAAITRAIEACAQAGGGVVEFPAGKYLTGAIQLTSHLTFHVGPGATLLGSPDLADYPIRRSPWEDEDDLGALLYGKDLEQVAITGPGTVDGQGQSWWDRLRALKKRGKVSNAEPTIAEKHGGRPRLIRLVNCKHVRVENITLINSPRWTVNPVFCEFVNVRGVTILNPANSPNTDGINPESCRNVHISDCHIDTGDDAITLKSGRDAVGRKFARPTENVTIVNCTVRHAHGGVVIGSEMSGDVRNVAVANCVFQGTEKGIRIKSNRDRGGVVEHISFDNLVMQDVVEAINIVTFYFSSDPPDQLQPLTEGTPRFRDIRISHVTASGSARAGQITGLREMPIADITLSDIHLSAKTGFKLQNAKGIRLQHIQVDVEKGPAIAGLRVEDIEVEGFRTATPLAQTPLLDFQNVTGLLIRNARAPQHTATFLHLQGAESSAVMLKDNDLRAAAERVKFSDGAEPKAVTQE